MKLTDLEAKFVIRTENGFHSGDDVTIENAQGLWYLCPQCYAKNGGARGTHHVLNWSSGRGVPADASPGPGRWTPSGAGIADLSFVPGNPPIADSVRSEEHTSEHKSIMRNS